MTPRRRLQTSPVAIQVFEHKCNWLIINGIEQLRHMFNEEEY